MLSSTTFEDATWAARTDVTSLATAITRPHPSSYNFSVQVVSMYERLYESWEESDGFEVDIEVSSG